MIKVFLATLGVALAMLTCNAAGDTRLALGAWSRHIPASSSITNETHNLVAVEHNGWQSGYFKNSYGKDSIFVARTFRLRYSKYVNFTFSVGLNRGYRTCFGPGTDKTANICPHAFAGVEFTKHRIIPTVKATPGVILFSPEIRF